IDKKIVIVEPGVLLTELNETLEQYDLMFPIEPLFSVGTIGGMIAKNSSGNREIKYNRTINWINSLEVINSKGELQKISKSDLSDFVGLEGITGIIVKATLRLTHLKKRTITILKSNNLDDMVTAGKKLKLDAEVSAVDLFSKEISTFLGLDNKYHLFVEYEGDKGTFKNEEYEKYMKLKNQAYKKSSMEGFYHLESIKFLSDSLQDFLIYLEERRIPFFSHLASGVVYPIFKKEPHEKQKLEDAIKFSRRLRGRMGYTFGIGLTKKELLEFGEASLIKRVKNRLDKNNKFNKDKLISHRLAEISDEKAEKMEEINRENQETLLREDELIEESPEILEEKNEEKTADELISETTNEEVIKEEIIPEQVGEIEEPNKPITVGDLLRQSETNTLKKPDSELTPEEQEKVKKIASGFFNGGNN
ncbi:MAG: FAD-binding oxidoreductase, partial [archaeon]|nr:FAD-binding oxidoreductase [archaeon]